MRSAQGIAEEPRPNGHFVQFYKADEPLLNRNVGRFLWEGLLRGDGLVVLGTAQRRESLAAHLTRMGVDVTLARREGHLALLDAQETIARIMPDGQPDWDRFQSVIEEALQLVRPRVGDASISAYGELVGVLWEAGQTDAAIRLEEYWNELLQRGGITLFCGYPIDVFAKDFHSSAAQGVLCAHTHLVPAGSQSDLDRSIQRALDDLLGSRADEVRQLMTINRPAASSAIPEPESAILWLRENIPADVDGILDRAREYYADSQAQACQT